MGVNLATALLQSGREREGLDLLDWLVQQKLDNPNLHSLRASARVAKGDVDGAIASYKKALELDPKSPLAHYNLGFALGAKGDQDGAIASYKKALELDPKLAEAHHDLGSALGAKGDQDGAIASYKKALDLDPKLPLFQAQLGHALMQKGKLDEALVHLRKAITLNPNNAAAQRDLSGVLVIRGRGNEARLAWRKALDANPPDHDTWYGYAELCLFLGQQDEYRRARRELLARFGDATDPYIAERTSRACLLLPGTDDELRRACALVDRAVAADRGKYAGVYAYFLFARGLAEYRQGRLDAAVATLKGEASRVLGPCPRLVLAMTQHRRGDEAAARKTLAAAVLAFDWRTTDQSAWIAHALRREAEALILPDLPALLAGARQPRDNDERLALLGACQSEGRHAAAARLYADAFAADPRLAADLNQQHRYHAACSAALAAAGQGEDAGRLPDKEVTLFRSRALDWLRDDLTAYAKLAEQNVPPGKQTIRLRLAHWHRDPDLASVRDPQALGRLADNERAAWQALWHDVDELAKRLAKTELPDKRTILPQRR